MRRWGALVWGVVAVGCYPTGVYRCSSADNCADGVTRGVCEATGFCSYPDEACPSGRRYDDLAGEGLAGSCVDPPGGGTVTGVTSSSGGAESTGPVPACDDADGDGFGEGEGCAGPDCDDDNSGATQDCVYISPQGNDEAAGTAEAPWLTFAHALAQLRPGMSLVALSGEYRHETSGMLDIDCGAEARNGTAEQPIFVRAEQDGAAQVLAEGADSSLRVRQCEHWRIRGFAALSAVDPAGAAGAPVSLQDAANVEIRRVIAGSPNPHFSTTTVVCNGCTAVVFEECEAYGFAGSGFWSSGGSDVRYRRCYANGTGQADDTSCTEEAVPGEIRCTQYDDRGDTGFFTSDNGIVENCIAEGVATGALSSGRTGVRLLGSAFLRGYFGAFFAPNGAQETVSGLMENIVVVDQEIVGAYVRASRDSVLRNITAVRSGFGMRTSPNDEAPCDGFGGCTMTATHLLLLGSTDDGAFVLDWDAVVEHSNAFGSATLDYRPEEALDDDVGFFQRSFAEPAPRIGTGPQQCLAYVPADSAMAGRGKNGADIGANMLHRYEDGVLTDAPLWDPETGTFPCGPVVAGVNDDPATSCSGVHERLHVGTVGCPLPADFGR